MNLTEPIQLVEESRLALQSVRRALIEMYDAVGADPSAPQDVSRRFELNRNLTWKLSRVIGAPDPLAALNHLPGQAGIELAIEAFERAGAPASAGESVRAAMNEFAAVVKEHAGDREQLELTLESMGMIEADAATISGRELAFRGNSSVWGVQAKTRLTTMIAAPGIAGTHDYILLTGYIGLRRLRPNIEWRLAKAQMQQDNNEPISEGSGFQEIFPKQSPSIPLLIREFSSPDMPELIARPSGDGLEVLLPRGQVGNRGAFDCFFGFVYRGVSCVPSPENLYGSAAAPITLPVESLVFDLIVHKGVKLQGMPEIAMYGFPHGGPDGPAAQTESNRLPLQERLVELAGSPPALATPAVPGLAKMGGALYARMGWNASDFRGMRLVVKHPPMGSRVVMRWPLV
jgi:hypothetical protein